jgi:hypothetical protein
VTAERLVTVLPDTLAALAAGDITLPHALRLAAATSPLPDEVSARVEAAVLDQATTQTPGQFGAAITRAIRRDDTRNQDKRHADARAERRVVFTPQPDGMTDLWAHLPADAAAAIRDLLHRTAGQANGRHGAEDERTADQRRADTLVDLLLDPACDATCDRTGEPATDPDSGDSEPDNDPARYDDTGSDGGGPAHGGGSGRGRRTRQRARARRRQRARRRRVRVHVTVALSTLLGLDEQGGELAGHGPIPAASARALAVDPTGSRRRILTDDHGHYLHAGARSYRPGAALDRHVRLRDQTCRFPGCRTAAEHTEIHHILAWADGAKPTPRTCTRCARTTTG